MSRANLLNAVAFYDFREPWERANYGAQLLGRAIGHADVMESGRAFPVISGYGHIVSACGFGAHLRAAMWNAAYDARDEAEGGQP